MSVRMLSLFQQRMYVHVAAGGAGGRRPGTPGPLTNQDHELCDRLLSGRDLAGWPVAVEYFPPVGAGGGGAVGVEGECPAPAVDGDEVVERAQEGAASAAGFEAGPASAVDGAFL
jgi:hypothetical protein